MKRSIFVIIVLILASLACNLSPATTPTVIPSIPLLEVSSTAPAPMPTPSPTVTEIPAPTPSPEVASFPASSHTIGPSTPPGDWIPVDLSTARVFLPPGMAILDSSKDSFLADLPVDPGTDQAGKTLYLFHEFKGAPNCGIQTMPDQAVTVADDNGFQYVFYRDYRQEVRDGHTFEYLAYWKYEYNTCIYMELALESASTGDNDAPLSSFVLQEEIEFLEAILSTYYELG